MTIRNMIYLAGQPEWSPPMTLSVIARTPRRWRLGRRGRE